MTFLQAVVMGILQGVTELFPVSSLGHSVILPQLLGWTEIVAAQSAKESYFLAFLVGLHVATALALLVFYRATWAGIIRGLIVSLQTRRIETVDQRIGWLLVIATIPAGLAGLVLEHTLRVVFATPLAAAAFLVVNGLILLGGEALRRRPAAGRPAAGRQAAGRPAVRRPAATAGRLGGAGIAATSTGQRAIDRLTVREVFAIGCTQALALLPGISRSGVTMVAGLTRGLDHEDAARFSFLLATPIIFAAGVYKLPDLLGPNGDGVRPQILVGSLAAGISAYLAVRFLTRWFRLRTLTPFAIYCLIVGVVAIVRFH